MPNLFLHEFYPEDFIRPQWLAWYLFQMPRFLRSLNQLESDKSYRRKYANKNVMIYPSEDLIMKRKNNGSTPQGLGAAPSSKSNKSTSVQWINLKLTDADNLALEQATEELPFLASALVGMVNDGVFVSIKLLSERDQYCVSIIRSDLEGVHQSVGISGFAPSLRDAILVALYKFHNCLRGEWPEQLPGIPFNEPKRFG